MVVWILSMGKFRENDCGDDPNSLKPCLKHFHASAILQVCNQSKLYWKGVERKHCIGHGLLYIKSMHRYKDNHVSEYWVKKWVGNIENQDEIKNGELLEESPFSTRYAFTNNAKWPCKIFMENYTLQRNVKSICSHL
mgnify:CR=1 FL=1